MMLTSFYIAGLALALVLLVALHRRLSDLPARVWSLARKEREAEAPKALDAMKEAVASRAGTAVTAVRQYEEAIAASYRAQVNDAEVRARIGERRAEETHAALRAALLLVRELRAALDGAHRPPPEPEAPAPEEPGSAERETVEVGVVRIEAEEDEPEEELTRVAGRPADPTSSLRPCIPPPSGGSRGAS